MATGESGQHSHNAPPPVEKGPCNAHVNVTTLFPPTVERRVRDLILI